jgi:hypothetical protein
MSILNHSSLKSPFARFGKDASRIRQFSPNGAVITPIPVLIGLLSLFQKQFHLFHLAIRKKEITGITSITILKIVPTHHPPRSQKKEKDLLILSQSHPIRIYLEKRLDSWRMLQYGRYRQRSRDIRD